ncbi:MAG: aldo/keto reductase [Planctomycetota bacterium]
MQYVKLGSTGMLVSRIGFGGIPIMRKSKATAVKVLREALERGINYIDTHLTYGDSEVKIAAALGKRREEYYLSTKAARHTAREARADLKSSLKRLKTDYIDLYFIKNMDSNEVLEQALSRNGSLRVAREAQKAGIVRHIGFTSHSEKVSWKALRTGEFAAIMLPYNIINREAEKRVLPYCCAHDIGFVCMKPLAGGILTVPSKVFARLARGSARTTAAAVVRALPGQPARAHGHTGDRDHGPSGRSPERLRRAHDPGRAARRHPRSGESRPGVLPQLRLLQTLSAGDRHQRHLPSHAFP